MKKDEKIEQKPLRKIPIPPDTYRNLKGLLSGLREEDKPEAIRKFYKDHEERKKEISDYIKTLLETRDHNYENTLVWNDQPFIGEGYPPLEKIEIREADKKKHGHSEWMLLVDLDFSRHDGKLKMQKIYMPLEDYLKDWTPPKWIEEVIEDFKRKEERNKKRKERLMMKHKQI